MTSPRVREALARTDFCHRDSSFTTLIEEVRVALAQVAGAPHHEPILLAGSATAALEAAFATLLSPREKVLVISNGAFGERLAELAQVLGLPLRHLQYEWARPIDPDAVRTAIEADPAISAVAMVHHDTSVGCLNPVEEIGALASSRGRRLFVDVVSSLGAEAFDAVAAHASVVIGAPNKCLEAVPGVSFVLVHPDAWAKAETITPRSLYLDLRRYRSGSSSEMTIPFTPAVHAVAALHEALNELADEGGPLARRRRYQARNQQLRIGFERQGIELCFNDTVRASSLTVAKLPAGYTGDSWYAALRSRGYLVYQAKGALRANCFLTANMGYLEIATIDRFLDAVGDVLRDAAYLQPSGRSKAFC
jgi:2-aminoethylphosphonate-pyruvate transaminase